MKSKAAIDAFKSNGEGKALIDTCEPTTPILTTTTFTVKSIAEGVWGAARLTANPPRSLRELRRIPLWAGRVSG